MSEEDARFDERAKIIAWLRAEAKRTPECSALARAAKRIEDGAAD